LIIESQREEIMDLEQKTTPTTGFNIRLFLIGVGTGILLIILLLIFIRR
jgi:CHASE3 domain sensor protein